MVGMELPGGKGGGDGTGQRRDSPTLPAAPGRRSRGNVSALVHGSDHERILRAPRPQPGAVLMRYPKRTQYKYAKARYRVRNWNEYEAGLLDPISGPLA